MELDPAVAHTYARALVDAAEKSGATDRVFEDSLAILRIRRETRMARFIENPRIRREAKHQFLERVFHGRLEPLLLNFLHVMLRNNRIFQLADTLRLVRDLVEEGRGIIPATLTTAIPLADDQRGLLHATIEERLGLRFDIRFREDPQVLGGVVFKYRDRLFDGSVRFDLQKLRQRLRHIKVA